MNLKEARSWIGKKLILAKPLAGFKPGLSCTVMCVVDFGDDLLLWITSDDKPYCDVDQLPLHDVLHYFTTPLSNKLYGSDYLTPLQKNQNVA